MDWFAWFGAEDDWQRPRPRLERADWLVAVALLAFQALSLELVRSFADFSGARPAWVQYLVLACLAPLALLRRRFPLLVGMACFALFFVAGTWVVEVGYLMSFQVACFFLFYSTVSWGQDRRQVALVVAGLMVLLFAWVAVDFAIGQGMEVYRRSLDGGHPRGLLPAIPSYVVYSFLLNTLWVGGSLAVGQSAWRQARNQALLADQAATIGAQAEALREQAVVDERLRIARELHDVVAHHVSVMGIQAAGARRLLERDPATAADALAHVENSSREAVNQMRGLLGALRGSEPSPAEEGREPQPTLAGLEQLCRSSKPPAELTVVEHREGAVAALPLPRQLALYRIVQEALTNVARHSTANRCSVTLRTTPGWAEAEVLDEGSPRGGTSGTGLGQLGMRERVTAMGGVAEIGPRATGGYRVRVRFPMEGER
ncbi:sensor histidine kinase [Luteococcus peritonei]|uniref:histidine kinase n=1 Tax=Luteococcus peritonei TaxID=88874 RepID=A0ABW4RZG7_9ACTN